MPSEEIDQCPPLCGGESDPVNANAQQGLPCQVEKQPIAIEMLPQKTV
jgi:hypothetical protein